MADIVAARDTVYGVNTGFGLLARTRIDDARLVELQRALVLSHSAGTGALLDDAIVRMVLPAAIPASDGASSRRSPSSTIAASCRAFRRKGPWVRRAISRRSRTWLRC